MPATHCATLVTTVLRLADGQFTARLEVEGNPQHGVLAGARGETPAAAVANVHNLGMAYLETVSALSDVFGVR